MTYTTWNPFHEFEALRRELERAFESFGIDLRAGPLFKPWFLPGAASRAYPLLNMSEDKDHVYVEALAPGLNTESLEVTVIGDMLRIAGEKEAISTDIKPEAYHRNERSAGTFVRTLTLPVEVDADKATADHKNGLLLITLPKAEAAKSKQISVKVS